MSEGTRGSSAGFARASFRGRFGRGTESPSEQNNMALEADRVICF